MSRTTPLLLGLGLAAFVAACAPRVQEVVMVPEPITSEPVSSGKYN